MTSPRLLCLLNVGNTHVQMCLRSGTDFSAVQVFDTRSFQPEQVIPPGVSCAAACVVPAWNEPLRRAGVFLVGPHVTLPFSLTSVDASTVGADRLANAAALTMRRRFPALCVDCGTAVDSEYLDLNAAFRGGAILPGRALVRHALHDHTALLPDIPLFDSPVDFPASNTVDALRYGSDNLLAAAVRNMVFDATAFCLEHPLLTVFCGGDREFFLRACPGAVDGGDDFTLRGVALIRDLNCHED